MGSQALETEPGVLHAEGRLLWHLPEDGLRPGSRIRYWIEASDQDDVSGPNTALSRTLEAVIHNPQETLDERLVRERGGSRTSIVKLGRSPRDPGWVANTTNQNINSGLRHPSAGLAWHSRTRTRHRGQPGRHRRRATAGQAHKSRPPQTVESTGRKLELKPPQRSQPTQADPAAAQHPAPAAQACRPGQKDVSSTCGQPRGRRS